MQCTQFFNWHPLPERQCPLPRAQQCQFARESFLLQAQFHTRYSFCVGSSKSWNWLISTVPPGNSALITSLAPIASKYRRRVEIRMSVFRSIFETVDCLIFSDSAICSWLNRNACRSSYSRSRSSVCALFFAWRSGGIAARSSLNDRAIIYLLHGQLFVDVHHRGHQLWEYIHHRIPSIALSCSLQLE